MGLLMCVVHVSSVAIKCAFQRTRLWVLLPRLMQLFDVCVHPDQEEEQNIVSRDLVTVCSRSFR